MNGTSIPLLLIAAGTVGFLHAIMPDHWAPLAVIARTQRWSIARVARISFLASVGHVLTSLLLAGLVTLVGLQFRSTFESQQGRIVGIILMLTGLGFLLWSLTGHGEHEQHHGAAQPDIQAHSPEGSVARRFAAIAVPFGAAASPDLTILPIALAASAIGVATVTGTLLVFALGTLVTSVGLTVAATLAGYQVKGAWLEEHGTRITALVLLVIGVAVYVGV